MSAASLDAARPEPSIHQAGLLAAAEAEGQTVMVYCRTAILERVMPERAMPEPELPDVANFPAWLLHLLLFFSRGKAPA